MGGWLVGVDWVGEAARVVRWAYLGHGNGTCGRDGQHTIQVPTSDNQETGCNPESGRHALSHHILS